MALSTVAHGLLISESPCDLSVTACRMNNLQNEPLPRSSKVKDFRHDSAGFHISNRLKKESQCSCHFAPCVLRHRAVLSQGATQRCVMQIIAKIQIARQLRVAFASTHVSRQACRDAQTQFDLLLLLVLAGWCARTFQ